MPRVLYDKLKTIAPSGSPDIEGNAMDPAQLNPTGGPVAFDRSQVVARSDSFQALVQGNVLGGQTAKVVMDGDSIVYSESTVIAVPAAIDGRAQNSDLSIRRTIRPGWSRVQHTEIHLTYAGGRSKARASRRSQAAEDDHGGHDGRRRCDRRQCPGRAVARPALAQGKTFNLNVVLVRRRRTKVVSVKVAAIRERGRSRRDVPGLPARVVGDAVVRS